MQWLNTIVDELIARHPDGEILIESGGSPSGTYHLGHMREPVICDAVMLEVRRRGREARHIYFSDDLDGLRKIPVNVPADYDQYLGLPLCDVPAPDGSEVSYGDYFFAGFLQGIAALGVELEPLYSHQKYRSGFFTEAIERCLERLPKAKDALETIAGRQLDEHWSPVQIMENGRLKNRKFISIDKSAKTIQYQDVSGQPQAVRYDAGEVKLDWRLDWPGRWWLLNIQAEPFGRDHATKGGSYDTGVQIMKDIYEAEAPLPIPYDFINLFGDNKKMSASKGTGLAATDCAKVMPAEVMRYFILRSAPSKRLYFDPVGDVVKLVDEFAALAANTDRTESEEQLLYLCTRGIDHQTVSRVPFSHLVASYQAALKDYEQTLTVLRRTEYAKIVDKDAVIIKLELQFIDQWLEHWAPEEVKFSLKVTVDPNDFTDQERQFMNDLAQSIEKAPADADGVWFHDAIYTFKDSSGLAPKELFAILYRALIGAQRGPRAGWFLSALPREWLIKRLKLEASD